MNWIQEAVLEEPQTLSLSNRSEIIFPSVDESWGRRKNEQPNHSIEEGGIEETSKLQLKHRISA